MSVITKQEIQECQELRKIAKPDSLLPKAENMVRATELLSESQSVLFRKVNYVCFAIEVNSDIFFVAPNQLVPKHSRVVNSTTGQLLGIAPVSGG